MEFREVSSQEDISDKSIKNLYEIMHHLSNEVYSHLGEGFNEDVYQKALQVEMRNAGLCFQREVNVEIFYKGVPLSFDRPDFIIRPFQNEQCDLSVPVVVELKAVKKLSDKNKTQAKTYLRSLPFSSDAELKHCRHCILINFPESNKDSVELLLIERL